MSQYKQLVTPNLGVEYEGGQCLKAVADAFNVPALSPNRYGAAMTDWNANEGNHPKEEPPAGLYVPIYFSIWKVPDGHIAISLPDGRVASSTQAGIHQGFFIHQNKDNLIMTYTKAHGGCAYLGWSETVDKLQVVQSISGGDDMFNDRLAVQRAVEGARAEFLPWQSVDPQVVQNDVNDIIARQGFGLFFTNIHNAQKEHDAQSGTIDKQKISQLADQIKAAVA